MIVKNKIEIILTPDEVKEIIIKYLKSEGLNVDKVIFNIDGVEDPTDYHASLPLSYELTKIICTGG